MNSKKVISIVSILSLLLMQMLGIPEAFAQTAATSTTATGATTAAQQAALEAQLSEIENEIAQQQTILKGAESQGQSLKSDITTLNAEIDESNLKIQAHDIAIAQLGHDITVKVQNIDDLNGRIASGQASLSDILEKTHELDDYSLAAVMLSNQNLSDFFSDLDSFDSINQSLRTYFTDVQDAKSENQTEKSSLASQQDQEIDTKVDVEAEKAKIAADEAQKSKLLSLNKTQQNNYQAVIANKEKTAAAIENALFALRDSPSIKFGDALTYAKAASAVTGVDTSFILAILTQESNLGQNVGTCYMTNDATGAGIKISSGAAVSNVMKPSRDVQPFLQITAALGRDAHTTRVSCPFSVGYGGAMGPAQFIPSTWMLMESSIGAAVGKSMPDPWNPGDAIMAAALYVKNLGAAGGSYTSERNAACKYYSGNSCSGSNSFYGDDVMAKATSIEANITILNNNT
jgi:membrane-bound lytic murein transglycosylase B